MNARVQAKSIASFVVALTLALVCAPRVAPAAEFSDVWEVKGKLIGKKDKKDGKIKKSEDVSGIACTTTSGFPRACLVIDDELQAAQLVVLRDGAIEVGEPVALIADTHNGKPVEFDGEGVAYHNGFFYVIGSHGHPRDADKELDPVKDAPKIQSSIATSSRVVRIRVDRVTGDPISRPGMKDVPDVEASARIRELIAADEVLARFKDKRLDENGLTVEGLAIRGDRLFVGFRGPSSIDGDHGVVLSAALGTLFDGAAPAATRHTLPLGAGRGVRDLAAIDEGLLILAGPTDDGDGKYAVYGWSGVGNNVKLLGNLPDVMGKKKQLKPEAILPLDRNSSGLRVLIMFDGAEEGGPRAIRVGLPD
jgi:hypothetical protein